MMEKKVGHKIRGDVDHKVPLSKGGKNTLGNLRVSSPGSNRSFKRDSKSRVISQTSKRERTR